MTESHSCSSLRELFNKQHRLWTSTTHRMRVNCEYGRKSVNSDFATVITSSVNSTSQIILTYGDTEQQLAWNDVAMFTKRCYAENYSHVTIPLCSSNDAYGKYGRRRSHRYVLRSNVWLQLETIWVCWWMEVGWKGGTKVRMWKVITR